MNSKRMPAGMARVTLSCGGIREWEKGGSVLWVRQADPVDERRVPCRCFLVRRGFRSDPRQEIAVWGSSCRCSCHLEEYVGCLIRGSGCLAFGVMACRDEHLDEHISRAGNNVADVV